MFLLTLVFLFQLQCCGSVSKAWVPEQPPRQQRATGRKADRQIKRTCVCARAEEGVCAYLRVHASVYTFVILNTAWAGEVPVAASPQPSDTRLEVRAVIFSHHLSLRASCLV